MVPNNYLIWQAVKAFTGFLSKPFRDPYKGLRKTLLGSDGSEITQWYYCIANTNNALGFITGAMFVRETLKDYSKDNTETLLNNIRTAFKNNLKNVHWMDFGTRQLAETKSEAMFNIIGQYQVNNQNVNGDQTLGENIADNGGLKVAYYAYLDKSNNQSHAPLLPGLNLTHRQLFFVAFAQVWCTAMTSDTSRLQIERDLHSPGKFKVIGSLSNLNEFGEEFKCKPGNKMNPEIKCEVW